MERKAKGKGYKKVGVPFMSMMSPKLHRRAHSKMNENKSEAPPPNPEESAPVEKSGKAPEIKKEE